MEINAPHTTFAGGVIGKKARGRVDRPFYKNGLEIGRNFICDLVGPASYREGFYHIAQTRLNLPAVLIPFIFNDSVSYCLEFTHLAIRVIKEDGLVTETARDVTGVTQANPGVVRIPSHGFSADDEVYFTDVGGMTQLNGRVFRVAGTTTDTFQLHTLDGSAVDTSSFGAFTSGGTCARVLTIVSPFEYRDLYQIKYAQTPEAMYIVHRAYAPRKLESTSDTDWSIGTFTRTNDPFGGADEFPGAVGIYGGRLWYGSSNNAPERFWGSCGPDSTTGETRYDDFTTGTGATDAVVFSVASQSDAAEQIRFFKGTSKFMAIGAFGGLYKAYGATEGSSITPSGVTVNPVDDYGCADIMPLFTGGQIVFTERGGKTLRSFEYNFFQDTYEARDKSIVNPDITQSGIIQMAFTSGRPEVTWAVRADGALLSCVLAGDEDVAAWSENFLGGDGYVLSACGVPRSDNVDRLYICANRNGTYVTEYKTDDPVLPDPIDTYTGDFEADDKAYADLLFEKQRRINRLDSSLAYDGTVSATLSISGTTFTAGSSVFSESDVGRYIQVRYLVGGETGVAKITGYTSGTVVTVEIKQAFDKSSYASGAWYKSTDRIGNLWHLEGETISVLADGAVHPDVTVSGGYVTLDYQAFYVIMGYGYRGVLRTTAIEPQDLSIPVGGREKTVNKVGIKLLDSLGAKYGTSVKSLYNLTQPAYFTEGVDYYDRPARLFTGVKMLPSIGGTEYEKKITIIQDSPLPCCVMGLIPFLEVEFGG